MTVCQYHSLFDILSRYELDYHRRCHDHYYCRISCLLDDVHGDGTEAVKFTTLVAEPDQPMPPRLHSKTKTSLQLKWNVSGSVDVWAAAYLSSHCIYKADVQRSIKLADFVC